jgi:hypothetical protein
MTKSGIVALAAVLTLGESALPQADPLARVRWLAGCWELRGGNRAVLEMWMPPEGGVMLGTSRTLVRGTLHDSERLRLAARDGKVVYTALPSGQAETDFTATAVTDSGFTVENPAHDFPQRIIYTRRGADSLIARIEGNTPQGPRGIEFPMQRTRCEAP